MNAPSSVDDLLVTPEGYERLCGELKSLRTEGRRAMSERLREARADGQVESNPALFDLLEEQAQLERRIATLEARLAAARIAEPNGDGSASIGSSVRLRDLETSELVEYMVVGAIEGNVGQGRVCRSKRRSGARCSALPRVTLSRSPVHAGSSASR